PRQPKCRRCRCLCSSNCLCCRKTVGINVPYEKALLKKSLCLLRFCIYEKRRQTKLSAFPSFKNHHRCFKKSSRYNVRGSLCTLFFDVCAKSPEFIDNIFIAALYMHNVFNFCRALCAKAGNNHSRA